MRKGQSKKLIIPKKLVSDLQIKEGDYFRAVQDKDRIVLEPVSNLSNKDRELLGWTRSFIEKYRDDLEELAKH